MRLETLLPSICNFPGRPPQDHAALARAFIAKAVFDIPTTRALIERLRVDRTLYRLCGFGSACQLPSEATLSRGLAEFADSALAGRLHEALITRTMKDHLVGHIARDATAIAGRGKPLLKAKRAAPAKRQRGRPRKGEQRPKEPTRLQRQLTMTLSQMLDELPKSCDVGARTNARGALEKWVGYNLHVDAAGGGVPVSCLLTSASLHDSQAAVPLARLTAGRVDGQSTDASATATPAVTGPAHPDITGSCRPIGGHGTTVPIGRDTWRIGCPYTLLTALTQLWTECNRWLRTRLMSLSTDPNSRSFARGSTGRKMALLAFSRISEMISVV